MQKKTQSNAEKDDKKTTKLARVGGPLFFIPVSCKLIHPWPPKPRIFHFLRQFYQTFQKRDTLRPELTWSHYRSLTTLRLVG